jgi:hypothetical protein
MDRGGNFQIHCRAYRMPKSQSSTPQIPRYWITIGRGKGKETIWDYPGDFEAHPYEWEEDVPDISVLIREYIDTPRNKVKSKIFENDKFGLVSVLRKYDRRFGGV